MSAVLSDRVYTVEDYMKMDDGQRYELIGGKLIMVPRPGPKHQRVGAEIVTAFKNYLKRNPSGEIFYEVDVLLSGQVVSPDLIFISQDRLDIVKELNIQGAPDLVIELLSPSTAKYDKKEKRHLYLANGIKEYWMVDPDQQLVEVLIAGGNEWRWAGVFDREDVLTTTLLPGLEINLSEIFTTK
ncbi:MAG: Uma2 family endonuclease [Peptococcaceae bacterium]|nr:Uma2 family endonuclease [Peptococcaceae bacterium]